MPRILITYSWVRSSYAALRNLRAHGVEVYVADSFRTGMCQASLKKAGFDLYPSHYNNEDKFVAAIHDICTRRKIGLIMPSHNETEVLARHRDLLPGNLGALLPDYSSSRIFNNKATAYDLAVTAGVPVPKRITYTDLRQLEQKLRQLEIVRTVVAYSGASGQSFQRHPVTCSGVSGHL